METKNTPPVCDYEGSDYQKSFWDQGGREYEDRTEAIALKRLLPKSGQLLLELGAGAGRNTPRYAGYERVVLLDYSTTQFSRRRNGWEILNAIFSSRRMSIVYPLWMVCSMARP